MSATSDPQAPLRDLRPAHAFFVGIDSDGCAFNSMEVKHNDCFAVNVVKHFGLAPISRQVHQVWDFVNLYSQTRGCNRFKALMLSMDHLREMPRVHKAGVRVPRLDHLRAWVAAESKLGNPTLAARVSASAGAERDELAMVLAWSQGVNAFVKDIVHDLPPFPGARRSLELLTGKADVLVVSATPEEALKREWEEHGIDRHVALIAGQELGSKSEHLALAARGKYGPDAILMVGDAPGDLKAARDVGALFFPINPGAEEESWERFAAEGLDRFLGKRFAGAYERALIDDFMKLLPAEPPWAQA
jgi:phosphoglycolate phosphatase-like HAD superfamily hydrolase